MKYRAQPYPFYELFIGGHPDPDFINATSGIDECTAKRAWSKHSIQEAFYVATSGSFAKTGFWLALLSTLCVYLGTAVQGAFALDGDTPKPICSCMCLLDDGNIVRTKEGKRFWRFPNSTPTECAALEGEGCVGINDEDGWGELGKCKMRYFGVFDPDVNDQDGPI